MSLVDELQDTHPSEVTAVVVRALREYLDEVSELRVEDLDVAGMAAQLAARVRFGWPIDRLDLTPPHGIERPPMVVIGLDAEPYPSPSLHIVR
jgi:hypothetical protein